MLAPFQSFCPVMGVCRRKGYEIPPLNEGCSAYSCSNTILHAPESTALKACGWWPGTWLSAKIFFWQFLFPWVDLALLKPMKNFPWDKMCDSSNETQGEKLFLPWRHSALLVRPLSRQDKNTLLGKPVSALETGWYAAAAVRFAAPNPSSSHLHFESCS